jgi:DNA polymerase IV
MAPELRDPIKAKDVARRLTLKAASRLRRMEYYVGAMSFSARLANDTTRPCRRARLPGAGQ